MDFSWPIHIDWIKETMAWHESHISPWSAGLAYKRDSKLVITLSADVQEPSDIRPSAGTVAIESVDMCSEFPGNQWFRIMFRKDGIFQNSQRDWTKSLGPWEC